MPVELTRREYDILALPATNPGRAFSRAFLVERLWGEAYDGYERNVDTHVKRLRQKLGDAGAAIDTVWGIGYRFSIEIPG
ncbi:MAG: winged helix-turn-helix domain-containing protein [Candidatus Dormibacteria bacterium]